jgi:hypothetical protein
VRVRAVNVVDVSLHHLPNRLFATTRRFWVQAVRRGFRSFPANLIKR